MDKVFIGVCTRYSCTCLRAYSCTCSTACRIASDVGDDRVRYSVFARQIKCKKEVVECYRKSEMSHVG